jgi:CubicO group peptidase (beta-lactamase class C family)
MRIAYCLLMLAVPFVLPVAQANERPELAGLDEAVARGLKAHGVPGLGLAIVKDGKVIVSKGYGVRRIGHNDPVTENTIFAIGSVTKSFTATAIGMLVDEGKLSWDSRICEHLPSFVLHDTYLTREATLRDALCHRIGLDRNEFIWYGSPFTRDEIIGKLRQIEPSAPFRTRFKYNNMVYMVAGETIARVGDKKSWDDFVTERIFRPLGMITAGTSTSRLPKNGDVAMPHEKVKSKVTPVDWRNVDNIGPAGSINASAREMAEYVRFHLSNGKRDGKPLLKKETLEEMHSMQIPTGKPGFAFNDESISHSYGLGWSLSDFKGRRIVEHGGNIDGMSAQVGMMPDEKLGIVILANHGQSMLPMALMFDLFDRFTGELKPNRAATTGLLDVINSIGMEKLAEPDVKSIIKDTKHSLPLRKYAGHYQDKKHAPATISEVDGQLTAKFNSFEFDVSHWHFDTFIFKDKKGQLPGVLGTFVLNKDGKVSELWVELGETIKLPRSSNAEKK